MALSIKDLFAASYDVAVNEKGKAANQWAENSLLGYMERNGYVKSRDLGPSVETTLDYVINPTAEVLATDTTAVSLTKTSVLGAASYTPAMVGAAMTWTKQDEALNGTGARKVDYVKSLVENAITSHDDVIEAALVAATTTNNFESLPTLITEDGTGTIGGIVAGTDTMWKNQFKDYGDASALLADFRTVFNACAKGSNSMTQPSAIVTSATSHGVYEGKLVANQRFTNSKSADGGFGEIKFANADVIFTPKYTSDSYFFINPKSLQLLVSKEYFRKRGDVIDVATIHGYSMQIFSSLLLVTNNRSRLGVAWT